MKLPVLLLLCTLLPWAAASEAFSVDAKAAVLIDGGSGRVLFAQNADEMLPMASTTKVMTALLALENADLDEKVTAGKNAAGVPGTSLYLAEGETLTMEQMLYGLMLRSGNDAAVAIAEHIAGSVSAFADMMNARAEALGARAHYVNPHGLDAEGHGISALGLALVMREAMKNADFRRITATKRKVIPWVGNEYSRVLENKNRLLTTYEGATGGKTGYTGRAGRCLVFSARRDGLELIGAVLNCPTWFDTAARLLDYGFESYRAEKALSQGQRAIQIPVVNGATDQVGAVAAEDLLCAVPVGGDVRMAVDAPQSLDAPVLAGDIVGSARIVAGGQTLAQCDLLAAESVPRLDLSSALRRIIHLWVLRLQGQASGE